MNCPTIVQLPPPPAGRIGWPWTEESDRPKEADLCGRSWPRISVITPSFNQAQFLEATIRSILLQGYPDLEYLVFDGGSTDGTVEVIEKYAPWISYWVSEPDEGQSEAINRGLKRATGEFATWINSDDMLYKNALRQHASQVGFDNSVVYVGVCAHADEVGKIFSIHRARVHSLKDLLRLPHVWRKAGNAGNIVQPEVLFPRKLALDVGCLTPDNHSCMDYELWGKFFLAGAKFQYTDIPFGIHRRHADQKSNDLLRSTEALKPITMRFLDLANSLTDEEKNTIRQELEAYFDAFFEMHWRESGRLTRLGLPRPVVNGIRSGRRTLHKILKMRP